jgi:DNA-binding NarL/FixJ family response regulator
LTTATWQFLSPRTMRSHLSDIYSKLGVHSCISLAGLLSSGAEQTDQATHKAKTTATPH